MRSTGTPTSIGTDIEDQREAKAKAAGLAYVSLDGDVGVIGMAPDW